MGAEEVRVQPDAGNPLGDKPRVLPRRGNLSSALRLFVLDFYRTQLSHNNEGRDETHEMIGHTAPAFS